MRERERERKPETRRWEMNCTTIVKSFGFLCLFCFIRSFSREKLFKAAHFWTLRSNSELRGPFCILTPGVKKYIQADWEPKYNQGKHASTFLRVIYSCGIIKKANQNEKSGNVLFSPRPRRKLRLMMLWISDIPPLLPIPLNAPCHFDCVNAQGWMA